MDKSDQHNDEGWMCEGFSKLMPFHWTLLRPKIGQICDHKNLRPNGGHRMTYPDDIVKGFGTHGKHQIENIEWFFSEVLSTNNKLVFQAYDANLSPTPDFSKWKDDEFRDRQINEALKRYAGRGYDVWLDDVLIWSRLQEDTI